MSANEIVLLISNLGFPIVISILLFGYLKKREDTHDEERKAEAESRKQEEEQHKAEIDKLSEAVNNNTLVMQKLIDKLS